MEAGKFRDLATKFFPIGLFVIVSIFLDSYAQVKEAYGISGVVLVMMAIVLILIIYDTLIDISLRWFVPGDYDPFVGTWCDVAWEASQGSALPESREKIKQLGWIKVMNSGGTVEIQGFVYDCESLNTGSAIGMFTAFPVAIRNGVLTIQYTGTGSGGRPEGYGEYSLLTPSHLKKAKSAGEWVGHIFVRDYPAMNSRAKRVPDSELDKIVGERDVASRLGSFLDQLYPHP